MSDFKAKMHQIRLPLGLRLGYFSGFGTWGYQPTFGGPFASLLLSFPISPSLPFPSLLHFPLKPGGCCAKVGGVLTPPPEGGVGNSLAPPQTLLGELTALPQNP